MDLLQATDAIITVLAAVVGGIWAIVKVRKRREHAPRISFDVDINLVGIQNDHWLVELVANVNNRGLVRHEIKEFTFDLRGLFEGDTLEDGSDKINNQTVIPYLLKEGAWLPSGWRYTFIEPSLETRYSFITSVPTRATFLLLHGRFDYDGATSFHTADCLIRVPKSDADSSSAA